MSDTTITPEERAYWRRVISDDEKILRLLTALEAAEAERGMLQQRVNELLSEELTDGAVRERIQLRFNMHEVLQENERLRAERDWLAGSMAEDGCPYLAFWADLDEDMRPDWCICTDTADDGFYCTGDPKECWQQEAARRADELNVYIGKLVYALTDGKLSNPYDISVITDEVEDIYQEHIREAVAEAESRAEKAEAENAKLLERLEAALNKIAEIKDEWESEGVCHACGICAGVPYEWQRPDGFCCRAALGLWIEGKPLPWEEASSRAVAESEVGK